MLLQKLCLDFLQLLFPEICLTCGVQLVYGEKQICTQCHYDLPYTDFHIYSDNAVAKLFWGRILCHSAMAMLYFRKGTKVQQLIHQLKYKGQTGLGLLLGKLLGEKLSQSTACAQADLIIPVPLHPARERKRGYNQSQCIADGIAEVLAIPVNTQLLIRQVKTSTQTKKNRYSRYENMKTVFQVADATALAGKHILLVDDVITTGATLEACGQVLWNSGISKLSIAAVAYAE